MTTSNSDADKSTNRNESARRTVDDRQYNIEILASSLRIESDSMGTTEVPLVFCLSLPL
jgi:hypothetical protein